MKKYRLPLCLLGVILLLTNCTNDEQKKQKIVQQKINMLNREAADWGYLSQIMLNSKYINSNLGKTLKADLLSPSLSGVLAEKDISEIVVNRDQSCAKIQYRTNWIEPSLGVLYVIWSPCDSVQNENGFYEDNGRETWGAGEPWSIQIKSETK